MSNSKEIPNLAYLSTYNKYYVLKAFSKRESCPTKQEFSDPLNEGFKKYLTLDEPNVELPKEDGEIYQDKFKLENKRLGDIYFQNPLAKDVIHRDNHNQKRSEYQLKYCDLDKDLEYAALLKQTLRLPDDVYIPLTTHKSSYRDPAKIFTGALKPPLIVKPFDNLTNNEKINEIINVKTGDSEYMDVIGKLGGFVVDEQMHGKIVHPPCTCVTHHPPA